MTQVSKELEDKLQYLQKELRELQQKDNYQAAELGAIKASINHRAVRMAEVDERLDMARALADSAEVEYKRKLRAAKGGYSSFREMQDSKYQGEPAIRIRIDSRNGDIY